MAAIVSTLLLCLLGSAASAPRLRVDLVFEGRPLPPQVEASAMEEVTLIWAAYGVDVRTTNRNDVGRVGAFRLAVVLTEGQGRGVPKGTLGSIQFVDELPAPSIAMYADAIASLASAATLFGRDECEWPPNFRNLIRGRVLGRALAHEIGHFLLRSPHHSSAGLMRARHPGSELIAPNRRGFVLSIDEVRRLLVEIERSRLSI